MKAIILVLSPEKCEKLLNGDLSILVRKKFPKDYVGWVYIYCMKGNKCFLYRDSEKGLNWFISPNSKMRIDFKYAKGLNGYFNGKVVARFWCDKVEEIRQIETIYGYKRPLGEYLKGGCLSFEEMFNYLNGNKGYAIHITKLEIFDKPKEINEFKTDITNKVEWAKDQTKLICKYRRLKTLTRAPQSWCYVEELK